MSEERRKRQQERESAGQRSARKYVQWGIVLGLVAAAFVAGRYYRNHRYDGFAQCLAARQAKMYGLFWCPHCAEQKEMFGASIRYVPYVECAIKGSSEMAPVCKAAGTKLFPSWQFGAEPPKEGVLTLDQLSGKTGCKLP